ncbi:SUMF1/EgtB/PvdO family nonheme iron enzyme [candidate division KSB1 bacterium]|nr:SUMF1/EgtB/PvdO family nonheme iron enzyme [candidate division KSB1 bacterium]
MRGGSWNNNPNNIRCANRNRNNPTNQNNNNGFRCVQYAENWMPEFNCLPTVEACIPPSRVRSGLVFTGRI